MLLPELLSAESVPRAWWVAHLAGRPEALVAAAAFVPRLQDSEAPAFPCLVRVLPAYRRLGLGRTLVSRLAEDAARWDVEALASWDAHQGAEAAFLQATGFIPYLAIHQFVGDMARALPLCAGQVQTLRARGRIPSSMRLLPLHEAALDAVTTLYRSHVVGSDAAVRRRIEAALADADCRRLSVAAVDERGLAGFLLATLHKGVPAADLWISDRTRRLGWVALMTLHASLQRAADLGATHFRFHCNERAVATLNFARRCGAHLEATRHGFRLPLQ